MIEDLITLLPYAILIGLMWAGFELYSRRNKK